MKKITFIVVLTLFFTNLFAQKGVSSLENARKYLSEKGEVVLKFKATSKEQFLELNQVLSVDHHHVDENLLEVQAYANQKQFDKFLSYGLTYEVTKEDNEIPQEYTDRNYSTQKNGTQTTLVGSWDTTWDAYPKYSEYVAKMQYWATTYPSLCTLQNIGSTPNGRALYVLKISDNVTTDETEPEFLYTSSMHGDEITGYPTMLHFIDYLLTNYGSNSEVTNIINGTELYICPLANPDGSYKTAGNDIFNSTGNTPVRANANGYDLNRNYPDPLNGIHPDSALQTNANYQPETLAFLNFERTRNFVHAANFHGGVEVVNYPWDTYPTGGPNIHPHDDYFKIVSQEFAGLAQTSSGNNGYMTYVAAAGQPAGSTNGSAWYTISGGRQDNNNYFNHNQEITIEVSTTKTVAASTLPNYWTYLKQSLLNYVKRVSYGFQGTVKDASGNPIHAKIYVSGTQDGFGSWVETSPTVGDYHKVQTAGTYNLIFEAPGYVTQTISSTITNGVATNLDVIMVPTTSIPTATDVAIYEGQTATLTATGTGTIKWYDSANAITALSTGPNFTTPTLSSTTTYYVDQTLTLANVGPSTVSGTAKNNASTANRYLTFTCTAPTKLKSVLISNSAVGQMLVELQDSSGKMLEAKVVLLTTVGSQDVDLDFFVPVATGLRLVSRELSFTNLTSATTAITYPITSGPISITGNSGTGTFFQFFNWKLEPVKSNRKAVVVTVKPYTWNGSVNNVWTNANNWSPNIVPDGTKNVLIPLGNPSLNTNFTVATGINLTVNGTGTLTIEPNRVLKIDGTADFNDKSVVFKSDVTGTGIFGQLTGTTTGLTKVTVERYIKGRRAFRFLTPGVTTTTSIYQNWQNNGVATAGIGTQITGGTSGGFDISGTNNPSMHSYNAQATGNTTGFTPIPNTNATTLKAGVGYRLLVRGDRNVVLTNPSTDNMNVPTTLSATGTLRTGTVTFDTSGSSPVPMNNNATNTQTNGYSLIGNPYVSPVDWHAITKTNVKGNAYYTWDPTLGTTAQRGRYVVYTQIDATTGTSNIYLGGTDPASNRRYLQSGQAVFVKNNTPSTTATLTFNESNKATVNAYVFKSSNQSFTANNNSSLFLTFYDPNELAIGGTPIDGASAIFGNAFSNALNDNDIDKLQSSGENLSFVRENKDLAIETLAPVAANDELFVKTTNLQPNKSYTFKVTTDNFDPTITAKIVDSYLNTENAIDLIQPSFVTFNTNSDLQSYGAERFKIVFNDAVLGNQSFGQRSINLYPNPVRENQFTLSLPDSITGKVSVTISNMLGQKVYTENVDANSTILVKPTTQLEEGIYIVSISNNIQKTQIKVIVKK